MSTNWRRRGLCGNEDPTLFFSEEAHETDAAKAICARCPVLDHCKDFAMVAPTMGVWAGMTRAERKAARPAWEQHVGPERLAELREQYAIPMERALAQPTVDACNDRRLTRAKAALEALVPQHQEHAIVNFKNFQLVLGTVIANPEVLLDDLAAQLGRSPAWMSETFRNACAVAGV